MVRIPRRLVVFLAALALTLCAGSVFAQALPVPINIQPTGPASGGLSTVATFDARGLGGAANAGYYSRPVLVSNNTLGGLARGLLRRSLPVAGMLAAIEAAGWAIDQLTGQVMDRPPPKTSVPPGDYYYTDGYQNLKHPSAAAAASWTAQYLTGGSYRYEVVNSLTQCGTPKPSGVTNCKAELKRIRVSAPDQTAQVFVSIDVVENLTVNPIPITAPVTQPNPVPDSQLGQAVVDNPNLWNEALRNPDGSVNRNPDVMAEAAELASELAANDPAADPTEQWDTGQQGGPPQPGQEPWPAICEWAPNLCAWLDWTKQEPIWEDGEDEIPVVDPVEEMPEFSPNLGSGSCPAPQQVETAYGAITIRYDLFCELALILNPLVLAAAFLSGAMIIVGVRRG